MLDEYKMRKRQQRVRGATKIRKKVKDSAHFER
jgi:hypothetical protein